MGFVDFFENVGRALEHAADEALAKARWLAQEAERKIREAAEAAKSAALEAAHEIESHVTSAASGIQKDIEDLLPSFDEKVEEVMNKISDVASEAASNGVDVTEAINKAVADAIQKVDDALRAAIDAINKFLRAAEKTLFSFLDKWVPDLFKFLLEPVRLLVSTLLDKLEELSEGLKRKISEMLVKIKETVQAFVRKIGEVLGPIWDFLKKLWRLIFGEEPEHCAMAAEWFRERLLRTENNLLFKRSSEPVGALIQKKTYFEVLPAEPNSWATTSLEWLEHRMGKTSWALRRDEMKDQMIKTSVQPGEVIQFVWDLPFTDSLGGRGRVQVSILYFRWRTDSFREVSAGFLGILGMVSSVDSMPAHPPLQLPRSPATQSTPLQMNADTMQAIYDSIRPYLRLKPAEGNRETAKFEGPKKTFSRQLRYRDDDGVWRTVKAT